MSDNVPEKKKTDTVYDLLAANAKAIKNVLPKHLTPERALRLAYTAIQQNPKIGQCSQASIFNAVVEASMLGLEIGGPIGHAHIMPFKNKAGFYEAKFIPGYKGYMDLAYRSALVTNFSFHPVYEKDQFKYSYGLRPALEHIPSEDENPGPLKYAYAVIHYKTGGFDFEVVDKRIIAATKARSPAAKTSFSPWNTEDEWVMWCKTAVRRLAKRVPQSPELQRAAMLEELAEAGFSQGLRHVDDAINVDFKVTSSSDLTEKIKAAGEEKQESQATEKPPDEEPDYKELCKQAFGADDQNMIVAMQFFALSNLPTSKKAAKELWEKYQSLTKG